MISGGWYVMTTVNVVVSVIIIVPITPVITAINCNYREVEVGGGSDWERERERMCSETVCGGYQLLSLLTIIISTDRTAIISKQRNKPDQPGPLHVWSEVAWPGDSRGWGETPARESRAAQTVVSLQRPQWGSGERSLQAATVAQSSSRGPRSGQKFTQILLRQLSDAV